MLPRVFVVFWDEIVPRHRGYSYGSRGFLEDRMMDIITVGYFELASLLLRARVSTRRAGYAPERA